MKDETQQQTPQPPRKPNGFAAMDPETRRAAASRGGKSAHSSRRAHTFTPDEARAAGAKGGAVVSANREYMAMIGRRGAERRNAMLRNQNATKAAASNVVKAESSARSSSDLPETD